MEPVAQAISSIIKEQMAIIGPIAIDQAKKISGLKIESVTQIEITGDKKEVLTGLIESYEKLFGKASVEVCKEAFKPYSSKIPPTDIPDKLKN
jgi:hypothetical protein